MSLGRRAEALPGGLTGFKQASAGWRALVPEPSRTGLVSGLSRIARDVVDDLTTTLFPADCRVCASPLLRFGRVPVCEPCLTAPRPQTGLLCRVCGEALGMESERFLSGLIAARGEEEQSCTPCRRVPPAFKRAVAFGAYQGELREMLHLLKYSGLRSLARPMGVMLAAAIEELAMEQRQEDELGGSAALLVVPVPLFRAKTRERGFNQVALLVEEALSDLRRRRPELRLRSAPHLLSRVKPTASQFGMNPRQRRDNLRGAFAVPKPELVAGRNVVLVDDIFTTGATARACSLALERAGARTISVATLLRAQPETVALWDGGPV